MATVMNEVEAGPIAQEADLEKTAGHVDSKHEEEAKEEVEDAWEREVDALEPHVQEVLRLQVDRKSRRIGLFELFRFATPFERFLNVVGALSGMAVGCAPPVMMIIFGSLTTSFTRYGIAQNERGPNREADLQSAKDDLFANVNSDALKLVYIASAMFFFCYVFMVTWSFTSERIAKRVRELYLASVLRQNMAYFDMVGPGEIASRIQADVYAMQGGIGVKFPVTCQYLAQFVAGFVVAYVECWQMALAMSSIFPPLVMSGAVMAIAMAKQKSAVLGNQGAGASIVEEAISSVRSVHAFGLAKRLLAAFNVSNARSYKVSIRGLLYIAGATVFMMFMAYAAYGLGYNFAAKLITNGHTVVGHAVAAISGVLIGAFSLTLIGSNLQTIGGAVGAGAKIYEVIDRKSPIDPLLNEGEIPESVEGSIELQNIQFTYPARPAVEVLHDFSATFPVGKTTALVGASGSGKSTIIGLVERFYLPSRGKILLDGRDVSTLNLAWLRGQISLVAQEPVLFNANVKENIKHGFIGSKYEHLLSDESDAAQRELDSRIIEAAKMANAHDFIQLLPLGYNTMIGERGLLLSGGQKQRVAIARAIVGDPKILLLDEATSALDTNSEKIVQVALDKAARGRTTIVIAHRLATIKNADQIIVMAQGSIVESGMSTDTALAHNILIDRKDAYASLVAAQNIDKVDVTEKTPSNEKDSESEETETSPANESVADPKLYGGGDQVQDSKQEAAPLDSAAVALLNEPADIDPDINRAEYEARKVTGPGAIRDLFRMNKNEYLWYLVGIIGSGVQGMTFPVFSIIYGSFISALSHSERDLIRSGANRAALYVFIVSLVSPGGAALNQFCFGKTAERIAYLVRARTFYALMRQDIQYYDDDANNVGAVTVRVAQWAEGVTGLMGTTWGTILQALVTIVGGVVIGICYNWRVGLVAMACIPLTFWSGLFHLYVVALSESRAQRNYAHTSQLACEAAGAVRTVASLTRERQVLDAYSKSLEIPVRKAHRLAVWVSVFYAFAQCVFMYILALMFWYGSHLLVDKNMTPGHFYTALMGVVFSSSQAGNIFQFSPDMSKAFSAARNFWGLQRAPIDIDMEDFESGDKVESMEGHVAFEDVHFRYPTRKHVPVLRGLKLEIKPGQFVAIVGASGNGKSTIIQLLERFYDPAAGRVTVDGKDVTKLNVPSLRSHMALVSQEPTLYSGTVRYNVALGSPTDDPSSVPLADIEHACRQANIHDYIMTLPAGYDTEVGSKGGQLSGGQKQRIAIARALIRNPKILLLDEATSALDSQSEKVVQAALDNASKGRTTISIAHRLSTIQHADVIYVLDKGVVAEQGKHQDLVKLGGIYAGLVSQQLLEKN